MTNHFWQYCAQDVKKRPLIVKNMLNNKNPIAFWLRTHYNIQDIWQSDHKSANKN